LARRLGAVGRIAKQGYFFVGGKYAPVGDKQIMTGQAYVEYQIPEKRTQPYPLVIVPGAAQTATNFNGTAVAARAGPSTFCAAAMRSTW
jgi:hypothetical protein